MKNSLLCIAMIRVKIHLIFHLIVVAVLTLISVGCTESTSQKLLNEKYNEGYQKGKDDGWNSAINTGREEGYSEGLDDGIKKGISEGYLLGYNDSENGKQLNIPIYELLESYNFGRNLIFKILTIGSYISTIIILGYIIFNMIYREPIKNIKYAKLLSIVLAFFISLGIVQMLDLSFVASIKYLSNQAKSISVAVIFVSTLAIFFGFDTALQKVKSKKLLFIYVEILVVFVTKLIFGLLLTVFIIDVFLKSSSQIFNNDLLSWSIIAMAGGGLLFGIYKYVSLEFIRDVQNMKS